MRILDPIMKGTGKDDDSSSGNVTTVVSDRKVPYFHSSTGDLVYFSPDIASAQDYYPFGMIMPGRSFSSGYRFGFNGKESDDEVSGAGNQYDYGFRIYNPRIAKFLSVDPLSPDFPWYTPYQFAGNKPIAFIDLDGLEELKSTTWYSSKEVELPRIKRVNKNFGGSDGSWMNWFMDSGDLGWELEPNITNTINNAVANTVGRGGNISTITIDVQIEVGPTVTPSERAAHATTMNTVIINIVTQMRQDLRNQGVDPDNIVFQRGPSIPVATKGETGYNPGTRISVQGTVLSEDVAVKKLFSRHTRLELISRDPVTSSPTGMLITYAVSDRDPSLDNPNTITLGQSQSVYKSDGSPYHPDVGIIWETTTFDSDQRVLRRNEDGTSLQYRTRNEPNVSEDAVRKWNDRLEQEGQQN